MSTDMFNMVHLQVLCCYRCVIVPQQSDKDKSTLNGQKEKLFGGFVYNLIQTRQAGLW